MVDDMRWMYALGLIWFTSYILQGGCGNVWIEMHLNSRASVCKTGFQQGLDRLSVNVCVHQPWTYFVYYYCLQMYYKKPPLITKWKQVWGCQVCREHGCGGLESPNVCYCILEIDHLKCHLHNDFSSVAYSGTIWRAELQTARYGYSDIDYTYSQELQMPTIYPLKWANFTVDGVRLNMQKCTGHFSTLGTRTFKFCAMGLVNPFVSMTIGILELPQTENSMCISRQVTVTENKHMLVHLNYSEHHDECNIHKSYNCDVYFTDCSTKVQNPVSLSVDGQNLLNLSEPICEMKLLIDQKHVIQFCREELKDVLLEVMYNNTWTNSTHHCIQVDLSVDAVNNVSYIFQYTDFCNRSDVYNCFFSGFVPTLPPVTEAPNTTCFECDKDITTPCYYCDYETDEHPSYLLPLIIALALLLIIGSIAWVLLKKKNWFWRTDGGVSQPKVPRWSVSKSQITSYEYDSSDYSYESSMESDDD